jgi:hypothetical protein
MSVVTCPGCNQAFTAGCRMCVHLYHSPQCCAKNVLLFTCNPFWLIPDETPFTLLPNNASTGHDCFFHSDDCFPEADVEDDEMLDEVPPPQGDDSLLDVVVFPQAYTTSQKYKTQLLKIIHSSGAPS